MSINAALTHRTTYRYDRLIEMGPQVVRLRPAPHSRTKILSYSQIISPEPHFINWQQDPFGNYMARLVFPERVDHFEVLVDLVADMASVNPFDFFVEDSVSHTPWTYEPELKKDLAPYLETGPQGPLFEKMLAGLPAEKMHTVDYMVAVNQIAHKAVDYRIRMEPGVQTPEETLELGSGSCRDSGWLLVHLMRRRGIAARFVSGYLIQLTPDIKAIDGPSGPDADFTDLHAWCEVYVPGAGWIGLDPTSGLFAGEGHIPLAATPSPRSAAPITGAHEVAKVEFSHHMEVRRVREEPRVTFPFTDEHWERINKTGEAVDKRLVAGDVRLTMGGEPTFVASDNRDADEWNTEAVGPTKRFFADKLIRRLRDRFAPGGLLHYGQGKWYPGEQLPRWAFGLYWRRDGEPLWSDAALIAPEGGAGAAPNMEDAEKLTLALADALEIDPVFVAPAYEDPAFYIMKESMLPENLDPENNKLDDPLERRQVAAAFTRGLGNPKAMVLPVQAAQSRAHNDGRRRRYRWITERWRTRRGRLFLAPGDSSAGYRLPLTALPFIPEGDYPYIIPIDPFAPRGRLPGRSTVQLQSQGGESAGSVPLGEEPERPATDGRILSAPPPPDNAHAIFVDAVRTAITVEPRDGVLTVFLPPVESADQFVDMIAAVEEAAAATGLPVHLDGYSPPFDYRINVIKVTPDPGVIEVNVQPAHSWAEQREITETIYEEARHCRLETTKFLHDGRPVGSGGGNHIVVGGASPNDSPFLRRPDLLASLIRFWQNHPSLSFLFSGTFIGPTSQAPRIDEARNDVLYELEIALKQLPPRGANCPPWLVDRLFRDLLTDATGNTHRAEVCIDKLYSPDGPTGRLGLVEFRAFEMPPHPRMSLAQALVLRALIAWFWEQPYERPLVKFGTALHDRYMLPHYVWRDFLDVLEEISAALDVHLDPEWFKAQFEFRFPLLGDIRHRDVLMELRGALEPWHVLGETGAIGGTARHVDSSVERIQLRVVGDLANRYRIACNGYEAPLTPTGRKDEKVMGIRFRAWMPPRCLHPTIAPHAPLTFDLQDRYSGRSLGGCVYHVAHPGGRSFETQPVNDLEAEGRRLARFQTFGHSPGPFQPAAPELSPEFPLTLDLRRQT